MRNPWVFAGAVLVSSLIYAKEPKPYQNGTLVRMDAVKCGTTEKDASSLAGQILGTDSGSKKSEEVLCQEYVLQSDTVLYRLRPRDDKHPALLPIGSATQFRIERDKLLMRVASVDDKEHEYVVVSMSARSDQTASSQTASSAPVTGANPK
jgi:hypothetical protein